MCGILIASKFYFSSNRQFDLNSIKHRGPDKSNFVELDDLYFGHTLLSIRDNVENSVQPVKSQCGKFLIVFNGQIYNTDYLIRQFSLDESKLDTKILSSLISKVGLNFYKYIEGMFAIVVYDIFNKKIYFYRDSSGQKNLYYFFKNGNLILSSEISPIIKVNKTFESNPAGILNGLHFGYIQSKQTLYKDIYKLLPGSYIEIDLKTKKIQKPIFFPIIKYNDNNDFIDNNKNNISNHLSTCRKIGLNLSGGIDSNLILYEALKLKKDIDCFSTFFPDENEVYNLDFKLAKNIAKKLNMNFYEIEINKKTFFEDFIDTFKIIEETNRNFNNPAYNILFKRQKEMGYRSILSGLGGDEIFIGYNDYFNQNYKEKMINFIPFKKMKIKKFIKNRMMMHKKYQIPKRYLLVNNENLFDDVFNNFFEFLISNYNDNKFFDIKFLRILFDQYAWLSNESFISMDKLSMHNSIELRAPLSSHFYRQKILEFTHKKLFKSDKNKPLIRNKYKNILPKEVMSLKKKIGWSVPKEWKLSKYYKDIFFDNTPSVSDEFFDWKNIKKDLNSNGNLEKPYYLVLLTTHLNMKKYGTN
jgi:asparagine synthase (glutamine-hydrolysing)